MIEPEKVSDQMVAQRIRNRIIDYLELAASFAEQRHHLNTAPSFVHIPNEVINQWEDWVMTAWRHLYTAPTYSEEELQALWRFNDIWNGVADDTPNPLPSLEDLILTEPWQRLAIGAAEALQVFHVRGRFSEDREELF